MKQVTDKIPDVSGLMHYTPEHDRIMRMHMQVVKNVNAGHDRTPYDNTGRGNYDDVIGYKAYGFWEEHPYSVSIAEKYALKKWTEPDMSDGGYQHPIQHPVFEEIASSISHPHNACWDNPRNGNGLRFAFKTEQEAVKFIELIKQKFPDMESD